MVATDTPEKQTLEAKETERREKIINAERKQKERELKQNQKEEKEKQKKQKVSKRLKY